MPIAFAITITAVIASGRDRDRLGDAAEVWFAKVGHHQLGYMVMLFADPRDGR